MKPTLKLDPVAKLLKFGTTNAKLRGQGIATFSLPAGLTCPGANECFSCFDRRKLKLTDGKNTLHRCYAASLEAAFTSVRRAVDHNLALLKKAKTVEAMAALIEDSLPRIGYRILRIHAHGDFFNADYFMAWMEVARRNPRRVFYAYTKSIPIWVAHLALVPTNFVLTASFGGKFDAMIEPNGLRYCRVVNHPEEAKKLRLNIDHDDSLARNPNVKRFSVLLHGQQKAGSVAAAAIKRMKDEGVEFSYGRGSKS